MGFPPSHQPTMHTIQPPISTIFITILSIITFIIPIGLLCRSFLDISSFETSIRGVFKIAQTHYLRPVLPSPFTSDLLTRGLWLEQIVAILSEISLLMAMINLWHTSNRSIIINLRRLDQFTSPLIFLIPFCISHQVLGERFIFSQVNDVIMLGLLGLMMIFNVLLNELVMYPSPSHMGVMGKHKPIRDIMIKDGLSNYYQLCIRNITYMIDLSTVILSLYLSIHVLAVTNCTVFVFCNIVSFILLIVQSNHNSTVVLYHDSNSSISPSPAVSPSSSQSAIATVTAVSLTVPDEVSTTTTQPSPTSTDLYLSNLHRSNLLTNYLLRSLMDGKAARSVYLFGVSSLLITTSFSLIPLAS